MSIVAAYDGSSLAAKALGRAAEYAGLLDEPLVVVIVLPSDPVLADQYGWIKDTDRDAYDPDRVGERLRERALELAPGATVRIEQVGPYAGRGRIAKRIRQTARETDACVVFVGSDNAGRVVQPVTSVGGAVAAGPEYDVFIVRSA